MRLRIKEGIKVISPHVAKYINNKVIVMPYLYVYVCILTVLQRDYNNNANLELLKAEDYMYKSQLYCEWNLTCINDEWKKEDINKHPILIFNHDNRDYLSLPSIDII